MHVAAIVALSLFVFLIGAIVIGMHVWGAIKDGEEDEAVQRRLGIKRRTRLGR